MTKVIVINPPPVGNVFYLEDIESGGYFKVQDDSISLDLTWLFSKFEKMTIPKRVNTFLKEVADEYGYLYLLSNITYSMIMSYPKYGEKTWLDYTNVLRKLTVYDGLKKEIEQ